MICRSSGCFDDNEMKESSTKIMTLQKCMGKFELITQIARTIVWITTYRIS